MIPGLYTYVATALVALALGFGSGWKTQGWRWDASEKQRIEQEAKERQKQLDRANKSSGAFEAKRTANEVKYRTVTITLKEIVDRPVYRNICLDDDGLRIFNDQISASTHTSKP